MTTATRAPYPWFGGKHRAAPLIWSLLGDTTNYVEPFFGSGAALLARPDSHTGRIETVNDSDGLLVNFWRAIAADPDAVAAHADWPVSECDLSARHLWLVSRRAEITERLQVDPEWYDAKAAGWWIWGICAWIGSGWCSGEGPWTSDGEHWIDRRDDGNAGQGINRQLPHLGNAGRGINRQLPHLGDAGRGIAAWFQSLADRTRRVRVCCGDWSRVCTDSVTHRHGLTGVFLDPPYPAGWDQEGGYSGQDGHAADIWRDVVAWAEEVGKRGDMRIVLAGYEGAGNPPRGWRTVPWVQRKGYSSDTVNSARERLWCSPACLGEDIQRGSQVAMFGGAP